ncbi:MAG: hypothetical protein ACYSWP_11775 [Planctomycetota bacterium]
MQDESIKTIGQLLTKSLPKNWEKVRFNAKENNEGWEAAYFLKDEYTSEPKETPFLLKEDFIENLDRLRDVGNFKFPIGSITFYKNGKYNIHYDSPKIKRLGINEIKNSIEQLKKIDLKQAEIDSLKKRISSIVVGHKKSTPKLPINMKLYRGVK